MKADSSLVPECWICGQPCPLEDCKVDETGLPVHEKCQVARLALLNALLVDGTPTGGAA